MVYSEHMTTSKSPNKVAAMAYATTRQSLPAYSHQFSPKKYTQHQLVAILVLKEFFTKDYRGITAILEDSSDLQLILELKTIPHFTTLQKAAARILKKHTIRKLISSTVTVAQKGKLVPAKSHLSAMDSTGLESGHTSRYFVKRRARSAENAYQTTKYTRWPKLALMCDTGSHIVTGTHTSRGPSVDILHFKSLVSDSLKILPIKTLLADAGYDSEESHRYAREDQQVHTIIPPKIGRPTKKLPTGKYRREMQLKFDTSTYGQRWQSETVMSMIKRNLSEELKSKSYWAQCREMLLKVLTHNIMILLPL